MKRTCGTIPFIILILTVIISAGCSRELSQGDDTTEQPWEFNEIPAIGQMSTGGPEQVDGNQIVQIDTGIEENEEVETLLNQGRAALMNGNFSDAIPHFEAVLETEPENVKALYNLSYAYKRLDDNENALIYGERAVEADPTMLYVHRNLGLIYEEMGRTEDAMFEFEQELLNHPEETSLADLAEHLSVLYLSNNLHQEAFDAAMHAINLQPDNPSHHAQLASVHFYNGAWQMSIDAWLDTIELAPDVGIYHKALGDAYWEAGMTTEAALAYTDAIGLTASLIDEIPAERLVVE